MTRVYVHPPKKLREVHITLPASKSISNRLLIIHSYFKNKLPKTKLSQAEDTVLLRQLLLQIESKELPTQPLVINCQNAGTVFRFLTSFLANKKGTWALTGTRRMCSRPIGILVDALRQLGAQISYTGEPGYPPLLIHGNTLSGGIITLDTSVSSQFISSLLMLAPTLPGGLIVRFKNLPVSHPYIEMTLQMLKHFGVDYTLSPDQIQIEAQEFRLMPHQIEPDWSSAAFWYTLVSLSGFSGIYLDGLSKTSIQGDSIIYDIFDKLGVETRFHSEGIQLVPKQTHLSFFEYDFKAYPDLAQAVAVCCAGLGIPARLTGLKTLRIKETDRLLALETELNKLGYHCKVDADDNFIIDGKERKINTEKITINTYNDHRMAMAFACLSPIIPGIPIENPIVVSKSYPGFWDDMEKVGFIIANK